MMIGKTYEREKNCKVDGSMVKLIDCSMADCLRSQLKNSHLWIPYFRSPHTPCTQLRALMIHRLCILFLVFRRGFLGNVAKLFVKIRERFKTTFVADLGNAQPVVL